MLNEANYPREFSLETFKTLKNFNDRINYCEKFLTRIAAGSARAVYKIDDDTCLKVARNRIGIDQNNNESDAYLQTLDLFAKVYDFDYDGNWLEMELARKASLADFKRIIGYDFDTVIAWIDYVSNAYQPKHLHHFVPNKFKQLFDSDEWNDYVYYTIFDNLQEYMGGYMLTCTGDLKRLSSWGIVTRNGEEQLVLIDYGLTDDTWNTHYNYKNKK